MNKNEQMIVRKVSFWNKFKQTFKNIFFKSNDFVKTKENSRIYTDKTKKEILEIYTSVSGVFHSRSGIDAESSGRRNRSPFDYGEDDRCRRDGKCGQCIYNHAGV